MSKYLLMRGLLLNGETGETAAAGTIIDLEDQGQIEKLLAKGTIVEATEGAVAPSTPTAFEAAQAETAERDAKRQREVADQMAREAEVKTKEETPDPLSVASDSVVEPPIEQSPVEPPQEPQEPLSPQQPTASQIAEDLNLVEDSTPSDINIQ